MELDCVIRRAGPEDIGPMIDLLHMLFSIEADFAPDRSKQRRGLELMLEKPEERCVMVAELDRRVIGMCTAQLLVSTAEGGYAALIEDMVVAEDCRGKGVGRRLLAAVEEWALARGARRLELLADRNNLPALEFYKRAQWRLTQLICLHKK